MSFTSSSRVFLKLLKELRLKWKESHRLWTTWMLKPLMKRMGLSTSSDTRQHPGAAWGSCDCILPQSLPLWVSIWFLKYCLPTRNTFLLPSSRKVGEWKYDRNKYLFASTALDTLIWKCYSYLTGKYLCLLASCRFGFYSYIFVIDKVLSTPWIPTLWLRKYCWSRWGGTALRQNKSKWNGNWPSYTVKQIYVLLEYLELCGSFAQGQ